MRKLWLQQCEEEPTDKEEAIGPGKTIKTWSHPVQVGKN